MFKDVYKEIWPLATHRQKPRIIGDYITDIYHCAKFYPNQGFFSHICDFAQRILAWLLFGCFGVTLFRSTLTLWQCVA